MPFTIDSLSSAIAAAGALGTASFGIVEGLKWTPLGAAGFGQIGSYLGAALSGSLRIAYGADYERLLRAQYRQDSQTQAAIAKSLRQGVRIGLTSGNAEQIATFLGTVDPAALKHAAACVENCDSLSDDDRAAIGRFELAADARIESALSRARDVYLGYVRVTSYILAMILAELTACVLGAGWLKGLLVGFVAVPLAPIANDVVGALQAATRAMRSG
ncbi:MAG TPA: hypothetical protein VJ738_00150 [Steroidobacteraceae bacterium]|nr:hypothetical protein [Steroidobacteraceae bacterium]